MRHLLVLLAAGIDEVLRFDPDPILCVQRTSTDDIVTWGMECPDCLYTRAVLRGGESYRLFGNRGTARYVGLQTMNGIAATANALVDELEVDADGNFEVVLSADERRRKLDADRGRPSHVDGAALLLRLGHRGGVVAAHRTARRRRWRPKAVRSIPDVAVSRQLVALGDFVHDNLEFFLHFGAAAPPNGFSAADRPHRDGRGRGEQAGHRSLGTAARTRR